MVNWASESVFYHIYPLGLCGAPQVNDFNQPPQPRLEKIHAWLDHIQWLGANALYLGPLFESSAHGYDTADYYTVDRRLGSNQTLANLSADLHQRGMRLILDGVFNHVGRDFWAFRDVQANLQNSAYTGWFHNLRFDQRSPYNDPFSYEGWHGCYDLVKLNLRNPAVREHLFNAVTAWVEQFNIDGLRLDAADCIDLDFLRDLAAHCRRLRPDFWLVGEIVAGDYRRWANPQILDSVTNYESYKGLYSSHVDKNYFEIAWSFNRQFGPGGLYNGLSLYAFADNHDVNRVASNLSNPAHLYPLHCLLFTMPGVPSIYYGSEWGIEGKKNGSDQPLRPCLDLGSVSTSAPNRDLAAAISRLADIRRRTPALLHGDYSQLHVSHQQFAFSRASDGQRAVVAVNSAAEPVALNLEVPHAAGHWIDALNPGDAYTASGNRLCIDRLPPCWGRILIQQQ
jgi:glycosidase